MYIKIKPPYYEEVIPILLRNLIILNYLTFEEVRSAVKTVLGDRIDSK